VAITVTGNPPSVAEPRLLAAATSLSAQYGYRYLTVARLTAAAQVSRATFYQYFRSCEDCFWTAHREHARSMLSRAAAAASDVGGSPELAVLDSLASSATLDPLGTRLVVSEVLATGAVGLVERESVISALAALCREQAKRSTIDLPAEMLIGAAFRYLSLRLGEGKIEVRTHTALRQWALTFIREPGQPLWSASLAPSLPLRNSSPAFPPIKRRHRGARRERIIQATAFAIRQRGYNAVTVSDIVAGAGISRRDFYNEFSSKPAAFVAAYEHGFQQALAACAPAFFESVEWPERVWRSANAFVRFVAREPCISYLGFVECYAAGREFVDRVHETQGAFTLFLEEGYRLHNNQVGLSRECLALTTCAMAEAAFQVCLTEPALYIRRMQPLAVYAVLAPFLGSQAAGRFVADKLADIAISQHAA
jgi:AcrR family transcriptional regulator